MDKETLQNSFSSKAWIQLIEGSQRDEDGLLEREDVKDLVKILKLLQLEEPSTFLLPLLDLICESSPDVSSPKQKHFVMSCPSHTQPHIISTGAFLLLEKVEGAFGTAEQSIKVAHLNLIHGDLRRAIRLRMSHQRETVTSINAVQFMVLKQCDIQAFTTLMQAQHLSPVLLSIVSLSTNLRVMRI